MCKHLVRTRHRNGESSLQWCDTAEEAQEKADEAMAKPEAETVTIYEQKARMVRCQVWMNDETQEQVTDPQQVVRGLVAGSAGQSSSPLERATADADVATA